MGKFPDKIAEALYEVTLEGGSTDEYGTTTEAPGRWWALILNSGVRGAKHAIVTEDSQGFVDYELFRTKREAMKNFERIIREVEAEMSE